jgi:flagellar protein FlaG
MKVEATGFAFATQQQAPNAADKVVEARKKKEEAAQEPETTDKLQVPPEELLEQIKGLAEDGVYSVRFEKDEAVNDLVVKIVDRETDEVIRQVPAQEILELRAALDDLRGNIVNTQS